MEALREAIDRYGAPEVFNTDQGSQFTSEAFTCVLKEHGVRISMDGKGRWIDNVYVERFWRSLKVEEINLHAYATPAEARERIADYIHSTKKIDQRLDKLGLGTYISHQPVCLAAVWCLKQPGKLSGLENHFSTKLKEES